jgi:hypothetical protein
MAQHETMHVNVSGFDWESHPYRQCDCHTHRQQTTDDATDKVIVTYLIHQYRESIPKLAKVLHVSTL